MKSIIISILFLTASVHGQNYIDYYKLANEAEHEFIDGDLNTAKNIFTQLDKQFGQLKRKDYFYLAIINYFNKDTIAGSKCLVKAAKNGLWTSSEVERFQKKFPDLNISKNTVSQLILIEKQFADKADKTIIDTLKYYTEIDQLNRPQTSDTILSRKVDFQIQTNFLMLLKKKGIPDPYIYGDATVSLIICHVYDPALIKEYKDFLFKEIVRGNMLPYYYCRLIDRNFLNGQTYYGTDFIPFTADVSKEKVKENRKEIGQSPYYDGPCLFPRLRKK